MSDAFQPLGNGQLIHGIPDLGGAEINLDGGTYLISRPLRLPANGGGNLHVCILSAFSVWRDKIAFSQLGCC